MARNVTLAQLKTDIGYQADVVLGASGRYTPAMVTRFINQSIQRFRERVSSEGINRYLVSYSTVTSSGPTGTFPFQIVDLSAITPRIVRVFGIDVQYQNVWHTLTHRPFAERARYSGLPTATNFPVSWCQMQTDQVALLPSPDNEYNLKAWYLPLLADLVDDSDVFDGVAGWEEYIVWDVVCRLLNRDQYLEAYKMAAQHRDEVWADVMRGASVVSWMGPTIRGRDTLLEHRYRFFTAGDDDVAASNIVMHRMLFCAKGCPDGGNGSASFPFNDLQDAIDATVASGTTIVLAPGDYTTDPPYTITDNLTRRFVSFNLYNFSDGPNTLGVAIDVTATAQITLEFQGVNSHVRVLDGGEFLTLVGANAVIRTQTSPAGQPAPTVILGGVGDVRYTCVNSDSVSVLTMTAGTANGTIAPTVSAVLETTLVEGFWTLANALTNSRFTACQIYANQIDVTAPHFLELWGCYFNNYGTVFTGDIRTDKATWARGNLAGVTWPVGVTVVDA